MSDDKKQDSSPDYGSYSLRELFRTEAESQVRVLNEGLLALDRNPADVAAIEPLMRAAHSLKGAARIVNLDSIERLAHVMEDCFVAAQKGSLTLTKGKIDILLAGVDAIGQLAALDEVAAEQWLERNKLHLANLLVAIPDLNAAAVPEPMPAPEVPAAPVAASAVSATKATPPAPRFESWSPTEPAHEPAPREDQVLKVSVRNFDRLLSLASESRVAAHAMQPYLQAMQRYKRKQNELLGEMEDLLAALRPTVHDEVLQERMARLREALNPLRSSLIERLADFDAYERRILGISQETLDEVLSLRMRPFHDGVHAFPRMVRDLARSLGKEVRLEIRGGDTLVDRDILAKMESPLNHILRNAVDHGMEMPAARSTAGKEREGRIVLEARHNAGMLSIQVSDDGQGVDLERIRAQVQRRRMAPPQMAAEMSKAELLDFLLLPSFSLKETASTVSGRGVGLDAVHATVRQLNGTVRLDTDSGKGFCIQITLPLSQSIVRAVVFEVAGEAYAIPISKIERVMRLPADAIQSLEGRQFFALGNEHVGLISTSRLLQLGEEKMHAGELPVIVIGTAPRRYALAVDAIRGEQSLAVQPLEPVFGKMRDVSAAALLDDGAPVLILDVPDMLVSIENLSGRGELHRVGGIGDAGKKPAKRILVVDDSLTVREMERKLLAARGFDVSVAVDGMDGWNAVRSGSYDLVITDIDMPRMDGIELVTLIKKDARLGNLPVMIVSYKDRPEDRSRGIDAGADYYLTKGSFHDETLLEAVLDLIGESTA
jgi:two-component system sensor histidine kinase and response regulator WspE